MVLNRTQVRCPRCGTPLQAAVQQVIDLGHDPSGKARLLAGSLNAIRCPSCGYEGQLAAPIVYHDPSKELLLTYMPMELGLPKNEQERVIGQLINQVINRLAPEKRKAYLLQPQAVLTVQGLAERVLEADGITREEIEAQRARMRLFEELIRLPDEQIEQFVTEHDSHLDETFFQLASLALRGAADERAQEVLAERIDRVLHLTTIGKKMEAEEAEIRLAAESLRKAGEGLTRESLLEMLLAAPNPDRIRALASLARPALDYGFFQLLTERVEAAKADEKARLLALREQVLEVTQQIDQAHQARVTRAAQVLKAVAEAKDLENALRQALPFVDEVFLGVLEANLRAARDRGDTATAGRLDEIAQRIRSIVREALPPGLRLAQQVLEVDDQQAENILQASADKIDEEFLGALVATAQRMAEEGDKAGAERLQRLHRLALGHSMRAKMKGGGVSESSPPSP